MILLACEAGWRLTKCAKIPADIGEAEAWGSHGSPTTPAIGPGATASEGNSNAGIPDAVKNWVGSDAGGSIGQ
jgi:hypothetical protein